MAVAGAVFASLGGATAGATLVSLRDDAAEGSLAAEQATFLDGFRTAMLVCAAFAAVGVLTALVRGNERPARGKAGQ
jgi:hypothetical protein